MSKKFGVTFAAASVFLYALTGPVVAAKLTNTTLDGLSILDLTKIVHK